LPVSSLLHRTEELVDLAFSITDVNAAAALVSTMFHPHIATTVTTNIVHPSVDPALAVPSTDSFYDRLTPFEAFADVTDPRHYRSLPADWFLGVADIVDSTQAIAKGRYKAVNAAGAAVIAAVINAPVAINFPFVFAGDGASFALPGRYMQTARDALAKTAAWAEDMLALNLRVAIIPVPAIRSARFDVRVARFAASRDVSYAMFAGGGLAWAEAKLKEGYYAIPRAEAGQMPDLSGLSCDFAPIQAQQGVILSIIAVPSGEGPQFAALVADLLALLDTNERAGRPLSESGPLPAWTGGGFDRAIATATPRPRLGPLDRAMIVPRAIVRRFSLMTGISFSDFRPARYRRQLVNNTDFRKFDDGLRMTVDCTPATADAIELRLGMAEQAQVCRFGTYRQRAAHLTCFVPSLARSDHIHFVDGATGGYAAAAAKLKRSSS
jgi:hypothetical protein